MGSESEASKIYTSPHRLEYTYTRTTGPILGKFFTGLRDRTIFGIRSKSGSVLVPPAEFDPETAEDLSMESMLEVGPGGVVSTFAWVSEPLAKHPLARPFAWALITLDGADTPMLHAVDTGADRSAIEIGVRVRPRWSEQTQGHIKDIECFEPEDQQ